MRPHRRIRRYVTVFAALLAASACRAADAPIDSTIDRIGEGVDPWLPDPVEIVDAPERRDEPPEGQRLRAQTAWGGSSAAVRRVWWSSSGRPIGEAAFSNASDGGSFDGGALARVRGFRFGAGALAVADFGLAGETSGLTRRLRGFGSGAGGAVRGAGLRATLGSAADLGGGAIAWRETVRLAAGSLRRAEGGAAALEVRRRGIAARGVLVRRDRRTESYGGFAVAFGAASNRTALDLSAGRHGKAARLDVARRVGPVRGDACWRFEETRERPGTLDLEAAWRSRAAAVRIRWRSWSTGGSAETAGGSTARGGYDDGRAELDLRAGRGAGALLVRLGSRPRQGDGSGGERFAVADVTVAREPGRTFRLTAGDRLTQAGAGWRRGRAVGAVLEFESPRRGSLTVTAEMVRAEGGAGVYGRVLDVSGAGSIRAKTRSGFRAAARGWIGLGAWRFGATVDDEETGRGDDTTAGASRAPRVNLWLAWSGGASAR